MLHSKGDSLLLCHDEVHHWTLETGALVCEGVQSHGKVCKGVYNSTMAIPPIAKPLTPHMVVLESRPCHQICYTNVNTYHRYLL
jgi:hypothetical protein